MIRRLLQLSSLQTVLLVAALLHFCGISTRADVTLPALLADHMVVQRGLPVHVWGMAAPHEAVSVTFRGESKSGTADEDGRWSIYLSPGETGGPFSLTVKATNTIVLNDILVGDVWVASGQSNMEFPMTGLVNAQTEIAAAQFPKLRIFLVKRKPADYPLENVESKGWAACTPETAAGSSAVAYFFARNLQQKLGVPIGLIESFWEEPQPSRGRACTPSAPMPRSCPFSPRGQRWSTPNPRPCCVSNVKMPSSKKRSRKHRRRASPCLGRNGIRISRHGRRRRSTTE